MNVKKQVEYWVTGSDEDIEAAESLLKKKPYRHALFFAHLALEKILKAHVFKSIKDYPPKIHNLVRLAEIAQLNLDEAKQEFLRRYDVYQLEGRYPDFAHVPIDIGTARSDIDQAKEVLEWLRNQL